MMNSLPLISHRLYVAALGQPGKELPGQSPKTQTSESDTPGAPAGNGRRGTKAAKLQSEQLFVPALTPEMQ
jgi:hypothetical protein